MRLANVFWGAVLAGTLSAASCGLQSVPRAEDPYAAARAWLANVKPCAEEDGAGEDQTYPCVWDGATRGNHRFNGRRYILYVRGSDGPCLANLPPDVWCYDIDVEWYGGNPE